MYSSFWVGYLWRKFRDKLSSAVEHDWVAAAVYMSPKDLINSIEYQLKMPNSVGNQGSWITEKLKEGSSVPF